MWHISKWTHDAKEPLYSARSKDIDSLPENEDQPSENKHGNQWVGNSKATLESRL